jgi:hypothetical protein
MNIIKFAGVYAERKGLCGPVYLPTTYLLEVANEEFEINII